MKPKIKKNYLIDKLKFFGAKSIQENPSILESILGIPITLEEFSGAWKEEGIFIKDSEKYIFLSRDYSDPDQNGRGNIILASEISTEDILIPKDESNYVIRFAHGGGAMIYDEGDLDIEIDNSMDACLREGFAMYDKLLSLAGIPSMRRVN